MISYSFVDIDINRLVEDKSYIDKTFKGKKYVAFGHSYTQMDVFPPVVAFRLGMSYDKIAAYGGSLCDDFANIANVDVNASLVTILYATNDFSSNRALGTISSNYVTPTTFYGALRYVFEYLSINMPNCKVIPICDTKHFRCATDLVFVANNGYGTNGEPKNNLGLTLEDYCNAIKDVSKLYSCKVLDLHNECGLNIHNDGVYYNADYLHPKDSFYNKIGERIAKFAKNEI